MLNKKNASERTKRNRLPIHVYLVYLLVATLVFTGVTFSKYVTSSTGGDSARVAVFGELELTESTWTGDGYIITPGAPIGKDPKVFFGVTDPTEMAAYVFLTVQADGWTFDGDHAYRIFRQDGTTELLSWSVDADWTRLEAGETGPQVFYRTVAPGESLTGVPVMSGDAITVSRDLRASELNALGDAAQSITFQAWAVQVQGFDSAESAWNAVSGG